MRDVLKYMRTRQREKQEQGGVSSREPWECLQERHGGTTQLRISDFGFCWGRTADGRVGHLISEALRPGGPCRFDMGEPMIVDDLHPQTIGQLPSQRENRPVGHICEKAGIERPPYGPPGPEDNTGDSSEPAEAVSVAEGG